MTNFFFFFKDGENKKLKQQCKLEKLRKLYEIKIYKLL